MTVDEACGKNQMKHDPEKYNIVSVYDITFYVQDEDGNEILNKDGTTKEFQFNGRLKPLECLCEDMTLDDLTPVERRESNDDG